MTGTGDSPVAPGALPALATRRALLAGAIALAFLLSMFRVPVAAGFELHAGMFFALLTYRVAGLVPGILAAALFVAPSIWWWGHPYSVLFAMALVTALPPLERRLGSLTLSVILFHLVIGLPVAFLVMRTQLDVAIPTVLLVEGRKLTNDGISASLVAVFSQWLVLDLSQARLQWRRLRSLAALVKAMSGFVLLVAYAAMLVAEAREMPVHLATYERLMTASTASDLGRVGWSPGIRQGVVSPDPAIGAVAYIAAAQREQVMRAAPALLGCDPAPRSGPGGDRTTVTYWLSSCALETVQLGPRTLHIAYPNRPFLEAVHLKALHHMGWDAGILAVALLLQLWLTRQISASAAVWQSAFEKFGTAELTMPRVLPFGEIVRPMERFVSVHNRYAATKAKLEDLLSSVQQLQSEISLKLACRVEIAEDGSAVTFLNLLAPDQPPKVFTVEPGCRDNLRQIRHRDDALVEFRIEGQSPEDWYLLVAQDRKGEGCWLSGCLLKLRQAKVLRDSMFHQARLIDLGGMASALSHELKQPLFTISLAAENAEFALSEMDDSRVKPVQKRLARVQEQVERARQIIERISAYSRIDSYEHEVFDLNDAMAAAARFMRPMMYDQQVALRVTAAFAGPAMVQMPKVGLEQVLVNALQNAVDAIVTRRREDGAAIEGMVELALSRQGGTYILTVTDNGTGLRKDLAPSMFEAFVTSKPRGQGTGLGLYVARQVVMEVGGRVAILDRPAPARGACLTIELKALPAPVEAA